MTSGVKFYNQSSSIILSSTHFGFCVAVGAVNHFRMGLVASNGITQFRKVVEWGKSKNTILSLVLVQRVSYVITHVYSHIGLFLSLPEKHNPARKTIFSCIL